MTDAHRPSTLEGAIEALPEIKTAAVEVMRLRPGDTIVMTHDGVMKNDAVFRIKRQLEKMFPAQLVLILEEKLRVDCILRPTCEE